MKAYSARHKQITALWYSRLLEPPQLISDKQVKLHAWMADNTSYLSSTTLHSMLTSVVVEWFPGCDDAAPPVEFLFNAFAASFRFLFWSWTRYWLDRRCYALLAWHLWRRVISVRLLCVFCLLGCIYSPSPGRLGPRRVRFVSACLLAWVPEVFWSAFEPAKCMHHALLIFAIFWPCSSVHDLLCSCLSCPWCLEYELLVR